LAGTAPERWAWLAVEQPGPWGPDGWADAHLPTGMPLGLPDSLADQGVGVLLIRRPGRHADLHRPGPRTVLVADTRPASRRLQRRVVPDHEAAATVATFDPDAFASGAAWGEDEAAPLALVCTHARRDACCALLGRDLLDGLLRADLGAVGPVELWEASHLGGHRFAATALLLPDGVVLGRAGPDDVLSGLKGAPPVAALRGRTYLGRPAQAADVAVASRAVHATEPLSVLAEAEGRFVVTDADGQAWRVRLDSIALPERPPSCGKQDEPAQALLARSVVPAS
jgi:hypothetical protein